MKHQSSPSGLLWRKLDLHVHTPASVDFDDRQLSADELVSVAVTKELDAIAITDHNTGEWVDKVVEAAKGKIVVFPGVEITASGGKEGGIHIVAIFDVAATTKTIENLLGALEIRAEKYGKPDAFTPKSPLEVVDIIAEHHGLAVLAHSDSTRGLLHDMKGESRTATMTNPHLAAVEASDWDKYAKMLDGTDPNYCRKLAVYRASDNRSPVLSGNHSVLGIGERFAFFKMDEMTLEGLRQCFCDPEVRIRPDVAKVLPGEGYPRIVSVAFSSGFLGGQRFEFHEGLNSIIGGKGVGKSLLVEFVRFALNQSSNVQAINDDMVGKLRDQLGEGATITIVIQQATGQRIVIERTFDAAKNPIRAWDDETAETVKGKIEQLFPLLVYSQTEAIEIAKNEMAQLLLIDSFIDHSAITREIDSIHTQLARLDKRMAESMDAVAELDGKKRDRDTLDEKIKQLDKTLKSPRFEELKKLEPKSNHFRHLQDLVGETQEHLESFADAIEDLQAPALPKELAKDAMLRKPRREVEKIIAEARRLTKALETKIKSAGGVVDVASDKWSKVVDKKTAEYEKWLKEAGGNKQQLVTRRQKLQGESDQLGKEVTQLQKKATVVDEISKQRITLLDSLGELADELYRLRESKYSEISAQSGGRINLELRRGGNRQKFLSGLMELKRGSKLRDRDIQELVHKIEPREFVDLILARDAKPLASKCAIDLDAAKRLIETLNSVEDFGQVLALQHIAFPEDAPRIQFQKDDGNYYDLINLSIGQKCTALLIIALSQGNMPVIIDQPEDALDIPSIYQDIALQLRSRKDCRQFILTTHNPTVAVAGDSDKFHVLKGTATSGQVAVQGAIDRIEVKGQVIQHLEGGTEPFKLKTHKYGIHSD